MFIKVNTAGSNAASVCHIAMKYLLGTLVFIFCHHYLLSYFGVYADDCASTLNVTTIYTTPLVTQTLTNTTQTVTSYTYTETALVTSVVQAQTAITNNLTTTTALVTTVPTAVANTTVPMYTATDTTYATVTDYTASVNATSTSTQISTASFMSTLTTTVGTTVASTSTDIETSTNVHMSLSYATAYSLTVSTVNVSSCSIVLSRFFCRGVTADLNHYVYEMTNGFYSIDSCASYCVGKYGTGTWSMVQTNSAAANLKCQCASGTYGTAPDPSYPCINNPYGPGMTGQEGTTGWTTGSPTTGGSFWATQGNTTGAC